MSCVSSPWVDCEQLPLMWKWTAPSLQRLHGLVLSVVLCVAALGSGSHQDQGSGATLKRSWVNYTSGWLQRSKPGPSSVLLCLPASPGDLSISQVILPWWYTPMYNAVMGKGASEQESCCLNVEPPKIELNESHSFKYYCISGTSLHQEKG